MPTENQIREHNQSIDLFKFLAALLVICIHVRFPGFFGQLLACLGRCAVPGFLAISGYFSYGASCDQLRRRIRRNLWLNIWGVLLTVAWGIVTVETGVSSMSLYQGSSVFWLRSLVPNWKVLVYWLLTDNNPFNGFFWYLMVSLKCYCLLWCYVRFFGKKEPDYRMLYLAGVMLYAGYVLFSAAARSLEQEAVLIQTRGTLLLGIPLFAMGLFVGEFQQQLWENFQLSRGKLLGWLLCGVLMSVAEQETLGYHDMYIGSVLMVLAILLLACRYPKPLKSPAMAKLAQNCGRWSLGIYMAHAEVVVFSCPLPIQLRQYSWWHWFHPVYIMLVSLLMAMGNDWLYGIIKKRRKKRALEKTGS